MAMVINTNALSLNAQNNLNKSQQSLNTAIERLSSGSRINSAKDDAAGLAISNRMNSQVTGLNQANRNANDGISAAQTAEGALGQVTDNLQRIRELTVQSQNGTLTDTDKSSIQEEIGQRLQEIQRIAEQTQFNGKTLLDGSNNTLKIQVGANDSQTIDLNMVDVGIKSLGVEGFNVSGSDTPNKAATKDSLKLAGATQVGTTNEYQLTTDNKAATSKDVFGKLADGKTVTTTGTGGNTYTYDAASSSYSYDTTVASTDLDGLKANLEKAGRATVTIGGESQEVTIDSSGHLKASDDGAALYLDGTGNLTKTRADSSDQQATIDNVVEQVAAGTINSSIKVGDTNYSSAGGGDIAVTGAKISSADLQDKVNGSAATVGNYSIAANGDVTVTTGGDPAFVDAEGALTTDAQATVSYYAHDNGKVTDGSANEIYQDSNGKFTKDAVSEGAATKDPLKAIDAALAKIDSARSTLGAQQNRLTSTVEGNSTTATNLSAAMSQIKDADYATEVSNMSKAQILQQAGTSVLAQANQTTQGVMSLLR